MRTYTLDADGEPALVFRARDDTAAADRGADLERYFKIVNLHGLGDTRVRPARIPEQEKWRRAAVNLTLRRETSAKLDEEIGEDLDALVIPVWNNPDYALWNNPDSTP
jgi:hypothetical protein